MTVGKEGHDGAKTEIQMSLYFSAVINNMLVNGTTT